MSCCPDDLCFDGDRRVNSSDAYSHLSHENFDWAAITVSTSYSWQLEVGTSRVVFSKEIKLWLVVEEFWDKLLNGEKETLLQQ